MYLNDANDGGVVVDYGGLTVTLDVFKYKSYYIWC